jgi:hypothetical protein
VPTVHDPVVLQTLRSRIQSLRPDSPRRWGKMSVDQMLWHVSEALATAVGEITVPRQKRAMPAPLLKFFVLNMPWPKGAPTHPSWLCDAERYDFESEKARCLRLLETFCCKSVDSSWPDSPTFGRVDGRFLSRLQAKHLDHHLKQFSA